MSLSSQQISTAIEALDQKIQPLSISPSEIASLFDQILNLIDEYRQTQLETLQAIQPMSKVEYCDASGYILLKKLHTSILTSDNLKTKVPGIAYSDEIPGVCDSRISSAKPSIFEGFCVSLFNSALASSTPVPEASPLLTNAGTRSPGFYKEDNAIAPFYLNGIWLTQPQVMKVLLDRYTPFMGGVQCSGLTNLPVATKATDSSLTLDYACCNNSNPKSIALGASGWASSVRPASMKRAFDNSYNLQAVIGEIDMSIISNAWNANNLFHSCPKLWQFHLANIPDCIESLDLSGVSDDCLANFKYDSGKSPMSSLKYLVENFKRDITRTKQLTIIVSNTVFAEVSDNVFYSKSGISWATA